MILCAQIRICDPLLGSRFVILYLDPDLRSFTQIQNCDPFIQIQICDPLPRSRFAILSIQNCDPLSRSRFVILYPDPDLWFAAQNRLIRALFWGGWLKQSFIMAPQFRLIKLYATVISPHYDSLIRLLTGRKINAAKQKQMLSESFWFSADAICTYCSQGSLYSFICSFFVLFSLFPLFFSLIQA